MTDSNDHPLFPLLRPPTWTPPAGAAVFDLVEQHGDDQALWLTLAWDRGDALEVAFAQDLEAPNDALVDAIDALVDLPPDWQEERDEHGELRALLRVGELASEALVSPDLMCEAAERLGCDAVNVAVPVRGILRVEPAFAAQPGRVAALLTWSRDVFADAAKQAGMSPLTPHAFVVLHGEITGVVRGVKVEAGGDALRVSDVRDERLRQGVWWRRMVRSVTGEA